jgi:hypothetical protein
MRAERWGFAFLALFACAASASGDDVPDVVRCKMPNGSTYFGAAPPENCVPVGRAQSSHSGVSGSSRKPAEFSPTPTVAPDTSQTDTEAARKREIERKRANVPAEGR